MKSISGKIREQLLARAIKAGDAFAMYRLPFSETIVTLSGPSQEIDLKVQKLEDARPGYIFAPFNNEGKAVFIHSVYFLQNDFHDNITDSYGINLNDFNTETRFINPDTHLTPLANPDYMGLVKSAVNEIKAGKIKKVVLARSKFVPSDVSVFELFNEISQQFFAAFINLTYHPTYGLWIGASPEILVSTDEYKTFRTVALAGTQRLKEGQTVADAFWRQKEIEEQALVSRYIINCFKSIRLREYEEEGPRTVQSGSLVHLKSIYSVATEAVQMPYLLSTMLGLLHPTSAVGGMPRAEAIDFILRNEKFNRSLFSGFTGPVNIGKSINIYVNIRCARLFANGAQLFAGAGITEESIPENEFIETEIKMDTICNFLR